MTMNNKELAELKRLGFDPKTTSLKIVEIEGQEVCCIHPIPKKRAKNDYVGQRLDRQKRIF